MRNCNYMPTNSDWPMMSYDRVKNVPTKPGAFPVAPGATTPGGLPITSDMLTPTFVSTSDIEFTQGFLKTQIGQRVLVEFLIGTGTLIDRSGILEKVGRAI
jgi:hypothetical protein